MLYRFLRALQQNRAQSKLRYLLSSTRKSQVIPIDTLSWVVRFLWNFQVRRQKPTQNKFHWRNQKFSTKLGEWSWVKGVPCLSQIRGGGFSATLNKKGVRIPGRRFGLTGKYITLTNRVRGLHLKLRTDFHPSIYDPSSKSTCHESKGNRRWSGVTYSMYLLCNLLRGTWGSATLRCCLLFLCGDAVISKPSVWNRCLCFLRYSVQWNKIICGAVVCCLTFVGPKFGM